MDEWGFPFYSMQYSTSRVSLELTMRSPSDHCKGKSQTKSRSSSLATKRERGAAEQARFVRDPSLLTSVQQDNIVPFSFSVSSTVFCSSAPVHLPWLWPHLSTCLSMWCSLTGKTICSVLPSWSWCCFCFAAVVLDVEALDDTDAESPCVFTGISSSSAWSS